jgi:hypothetical protein
MKTRELSQKQSDTLQKLILNCQDLVQNSLEDGKQISLLIECINTDLQRLSDVGLTKELEHTNGAT